MRATKETSLSQLPEQSAGSLLRSNFIKTLQKLMRRKRLQCKPFIKTLLTQLKNDREISLEQFEALLPILKREKEFKGYPHCFYDLSDWVREFSSVINPNHPRIQENLL